MELFFRRLGQGKDFVILHGLYGMSDNWISIARSFSIEFNVWLLDLRNHGRSPHYYSHTYNEMADDVYKFIIQHNIEKPIVAGHSMGGKVAMTLAKLYPKLINKLIVIDIAPINYSLYNFKEVNVHKHIIESLKNLEIENIYQRSEADSLLSKQIKEPSLRAFLLKNLQRNEQGKFYWLLNIPVIEANLNNIINGFDDWDNVFIDIPTLFIRGEKSDYIRNEFIPIIQNIFKLHYISVIKSAGHWIHADNTEDFIQAIKLFLKSS